MKYLKAEAEVIEFDNGDVVTWSCQVCHLTGDGDSVPYHVITRSWTMPVWLYALLQLLGYDGDQTLEEGDPCPGGPGSASATSATSTMSLDDPDWL